MKIKNIIIEGPDCSGKSTLVNRIKNMLRWDSKSLHHREGHQFTRYIQEYANSKNTVFDRSHFSEEVYSILWRGGSPFSKEEKEILNNICKLNTLIIFTCPELKTIRERHSSRDYQQQITFNELEKSRELFSKTFENIPHILYLSENYEELEELIEKIKIIIRESQNN
jgi:thymidylate kinase